MTKTIIYMKKNEKSLERVDIYMSNILNVSRSSARKMIQRSLIKINGIVPKKFGIILKNGDSITIDEKIEQEFAIAPIDDFLDIKFQNENFLIILKPSGLLTHPTKFNEEKSLAGVIKFYWNKIGNKSFSDHDIRQGICHRLDKFTTGLLIIARNPDIQAQLMLLIKNNEVKREYIAILEGQMQTNQVTVNCPIERVRKNGIRMGVSSNWTAKNAVTHFSVIQRYHGLCVVKCVLETGRTHQIRVHSKYMNCPIVNDPLYGNKHPIDNYGQYLVANKIEFQDPFSKELIKIEIEQPKEFENYLSSVQSDN